MSGQSSRRGRRRLCVGRLAAGSQPGVRIGPVEPRETGSIYGPELRAWAVRVGTGRTYHVGEHEHANTLAVSERGLPLACGCQAHLIRRWCGHANHVARAIGGRPAGGDQ